MITVHKCQVLAGVGRWTSPKLRVAIMVSAYLGSIDRLEVRAVQNVLVPLVGFHNGSPSDDNKCDKYNRGDDHVSVLPEKCIED
jgi:hypothetical protein